MNHNFANWELTQLLPEFNPYGRRFIEDDDYPNSNNFCMQWYNIDDVITIQPSTSSLPERGFPCLRDAWTYEDIRLYLESKGYIITVYPYVDDVSIDEPQYQILYTYEVLKDYETDIDFTYYNTYEEARNEAIMYCLNLINTNNGHTNNREGK